MSLFSWSLNSAGTSSQDARHGQQHFFAASPSGAYAAGAPQASPGLVAGPGLPYVLHPAAIETAGVLTPPAASGAQQQGSGGSGWTWKAAVPRGVQQRASRATPKPSRLGGPFFLADAGGVLAPRQRLPPAASLDLSYGIASCSIFYFHPAATLATERSARIT